MSYAALEQKLRMVEEQDFDFVSKFLDLVLGKEQRDRNAEKESENDYLSMLNKSFSQLERGEVIVKSMEELRAMEQD